MATEPIHSEDENAANKKMELEVALRSLVEHTYQLKRKAALVWMHSGLLLGMLLTGYIMRIAIYANSPIMPAGVTLICLIGLSFNLMGFLVLLQWERERKEGMLLYEEISDEVEWRHRTFRPNEQERSVTNGASVPLTLRLTLRKFLASAELPFAPSPTSVTIYAVFYLLCIVGFMILLAITSSGGRLTWMI